MNWFKKKHVEISLTDLLQRQEYLDDFVDAQAKATQAMMQNPMMMQLSKCEELQREAEISLFFSSFSFAFL